MKMSPVAALVRGWVDLYTRGMPPTIRAARRDEVDDDLWCQHDEAITNGRPLRSLSFEMFIRTLLGIPADISWRLAHAGGAGTPAPERRSTAATRVIGMLAVIGGVSWLIGAANYLIGGTMGDENESTILSLVGATAFAGAVGGLTWRFQDHLTPGGALVGVLAALAVVMGISGAYIFFPAFPVGSAVLVWELGRASIVSRRLSVVHGVSALGMLVLLVSMLIDWRMVYDNSAFIWLVVPYLLTWVAIGGSVLRGVPEVPAASKPNP